MSGSARISPTAHYTGYVWYRHDLAHPAFRTWTGSMMFHALAPFNAVALRLGVPTLEGLLLARHRAIDHVLEQEVASGRIQQVIEIAAGLSPRGYGFVRRHGERITYVEADLPDMAARKQKILARTGQSGAHHRVVPLDALAESGPLSLSALADTLDPSRGLAIVTEGLLVYFPGDAVQGMWRRFADTLSRFESGLYVSDLQLAAHNPGVGRVFAGAVAAFVRGRLHFPFERESDAIAGLRRAGFGTAEILVPEAWVAPSGRPDVAGADVVRVIRAR